MEVIKTGEQLLRDALGVLQMCGIKPRFWSKVMELWGVKGVDYGEYIAPRATSMEAWAQIKYDEVVPMQVRFTLAKLEVVMVQRLKSAPLLLERLESRSDGSRLIKGESALRCVMMVHLCFPPNSEHHGMFETHLTLLREAGLKRLKGDKLDRLHRVLLDFAG